MKRWTRWAIVSAMALCVWSDPTPAVETYLNPKDGSVLVSVPAGEFFMGARTDDRAAEDNEKPGRKVRLPAYQISKYEVTNAQYAAFVQATGHVQDKSWERFARRSGKKAAVVSVSWHDAKAYCDWAGLRLPTEAEWERAARGTDGRIYPWGDQWDAKKSVFGFLADGPKEPSCKPGTRDVGSKPAGISPVGCLDMAGNAWEWTSDQVTRGGSWVVDPVLLRCSFRVRVAPTLRNDDLGFRCARTPP